MSEQPKGSYKLKVDCTNCEWKGEVEIPRGTTVYEMPCPQCGCRTLERQ